MPPNESRLFLALWPPAPVTAELAAGMRRWQWPAAARLTRPERLHLTLHFIGAVPDDRLDEMRERLEVPWQPFELTLSQPQLWGSIAVLCTAELPPALGALHGALATALGSMQIPVESRAFSPHVTFARQARGARPPQPHPPVRWRADQGYRLVRSLPGGRGYEPVALYG
jgi:2'-5' RNA ligase